jgi:hypothetical protein
VQSVWIAALCLISATLLAQDIGPTGPGTEYAPCLDGQAGTRVYEGSQLVSPDGRWRAYASVEARPDSTFGCSNTSTLLVEGPGERTFQIVHTRRPEPYLQGNGISPISWSPRGHLLAVKLFHFQFMSDAAAFGVLVYDADRKRAIEPDLAKLFAQKYNKEECAFDIRDVLGFDSQNRVLFSANDVIDPGDDEPVPQTRCVGGPSEWALDIESNQLELVKHLGAEDSQ